MKNFRMNRKGISPIFATLILIAIAVIAGVVVYMFTSGTLASMTGNTQAANEKVAVQGASVTITGTSVTAYVNNMATTGSVTVNGLIIKDANGNTVATYTGSGTPVVPLAQAVSAGQLVAISGTYTAVGTITAGNTYTVTVTTARGGSFVSAGVVAAA